MHLELLDVRFLDIYCDTTNHFPQENLDKKERNANVSIYDLLIRAMSEHFCYYPISNEMDYTKVFECLLKYILLMNLLVAIQEQSHY